MRLFFKAGGKQREGQTVQDEETWPAGRRARGEQGRGGREGFGGG